MSLVRNTVIALVVVSTLVPASATVADAAEEEPTQVGPAGDGAAANGGLPRPTDVSTSMTRQPTDLGTSLGGPPASMLTLAEVPIPVIAAFARRHDGEPLSNSGREAVYEAVSASPGIYPAAVAEELGVSWTTVRYHTYVLERAGLVDGAKIRGRYRLYPADEGDVELVAALSEEPTESVLDAVARLEPASVSTLADDLDLAESTVSYHLGRLADDGIVQRQRVGRQVLTRLHEPTRETLANDD